VHLVARPTTHRLAHLVQSLRGLLARLEAEQARLGVERRVRLVSLRTMQQPPLLSLVNPPPRTQQVPLVALLEVASLEESRPLVPVHSQVKHYNHSQMDMDLIFLP